MDAPCVEPAVHHLLAHVSSTLQGVPYNCILWKNPLYENVADRQHTVLAVTS